MGLVECFGEIRANLRIVRGYLAMGSTPHVDRRSTTTWLTLRVRWRRWKGRRVFLTFLTGGGVTGVQVVGEKGWHFSQTLEIWLYYYVVEIECLDIWMLWWLFFVVWGYLIRVETKTIVFISCAGVCRLGGTLVCIEDREVSNEKKNLVV